MRFGPSILALLIPVSAIYLLIGALQAGTRNQNVAGSLALALETARTSATPESPVERMIVAFRADPTPAQALPLLRATGILSSGRSLDEDRVRVRRHRNGWFSVIFHTDAYELEDRWGVLTLSSSNQLAALRGDGWLSLTTEDEPVSFLSLGDRAAPILTLRERDGGSGGYEVLLRVYTLDQDEWQARGTVALSYCWRAPGFFELCGADTPCNRRRVMTIARGSQLLIEGHEERYTRLECKVDRELIPVERRTSRLTEEYAFAADGRLVLQKREEQCLRVERVLIRPSDGVVLTDRR